MTKPPTIAMQFVTSAVQTATDFDIEPETILRMTGLTIEDIADQTQQFSLCQYIQLLESIAVISQDNCFGLHHGSTHHLSDFGILGYILLNSATVGCSLKSLTRYFNVWQQATEVNLTLEGDTSWLSYKISDTCIKTRKQDTEAAMAFGVNIIRTLTRQKNWHPTAVWLEHEPPVDMSEHQRILGTALFFNQPINAIAIQQEILEQKIPLADRSLLPVLEQHLQILLI